MIVASTNQSERRLASTKSKDKGSSLPSKSRSPNRMHTSTSNFPTSQSGTLAPLVQGPPRSSPPVGPPRTRPLRRPHTSAGPRDTSNLPLHSEFELKERNINPTDRAFHSAGPLPRKTTTRSVLQDPHFSAKTRAVVHHDACNHVILQQISLDHIRDWEEELARIELRSWRSSADMLGFRKR